MQPPNEANYTQFLYTPWIVMGDRKGMRVRQGPSSSRPMVLI